MDIGAAAFVAQETKFRKKIIVIPECWSKKLVPLLYKCRSPRLNNQSCNRKSRENSWHRKPALEFIDSERRVVSPRAEKKKTSIATSSAALGSRKSRSSSGSIPPTTESSLTTPKTTLQFHSGRYHQKSNRSIHPRSPRREKEPAARTCTHQRNRILPGSPPPHYNNEIKRVIFVNPRALGGTWHFVISPFARAYRR